MKFYKGRKNNQPVDFIGYLTEWSDIKILENSCIAVYESESMKIGNIIIEKQNDLGFVSVKHIKECVANEERKVSEIMLKIEERELVRDMLTKFQTTINQVKMTINNLILGRNMSSRFDKALNLINENQKNGTGNWFIFLNVDESLL